MYACSLCEGRLFEIPFQVKKLKISAKNIGISLPEHAYIRAGCSAGKKPTTAERL